LAFKALAPQFASDPALSAAVAPHDPPHMAFWYFRYRLQSTVISILNFDSSFDIFFIFVLI